MIKKLRAKLILASMFSLALVLLIILGGVNLMSYQNVVSDADSVLTVLASNNGAFPRPQGGLRGEGSAAPGAPKGGKPFLTGPGMSPEPPYESRYFWVLLGENGQVIQTQTDQIVAVDEADADAYAATVWASGRTSGFLEDYRYLVSQEADGARIIFLDCHRSLSSFRITLMASAALSLLGLGAVLVLLLLLSRRTMQDGSCVLDETEELLDRWNAKYAADLYDGGLAVFLFCGEDVAATQDLFARLTHYLKNNLCTRVQIRLGTASKVFGDYPKAFLDLAKLEEAEKVNSRAFIRENDLENAVRQKNFSAAMKALQPALESLEKRENEDFTKCQLLMALNQCSRQLLIGQTAGDAPYQVSKLISASGRKQITEITARYLEWLIENYAPPERLNNAVQAVLNLVRADCSQPWSIDSIADRLHVNGGYLSHLFKEHTGRCFTDYLAEQRINLAVDLMQTTDLSLAQIGEKVGYRPAHGGEL